MTGINIEPEVDPHPVQRVGLFANGMVMVFCVEGHQIPQYQGPWEEVKDVLLNTVSERDSTIREGYFDQGEAKQ